MFQMIVIVVVLLLIIGQLTTGDVIGFLMVIINAIVSVIVAFFNLIV